MCQSIILTQPAAIQYCNVGPTFETDRFNKQFSRTMLARSQNDLNDNLSWLKNDWLKHKYNGCPPFQHRCRTSLVEGRVLDAIGAQLVYRKHEGIPLHYKNIT